MDSFTDGKRKCGFCKEEIEKGWRRCPYCGSLLDIKVEEVRLNAEESKQAGFGSLDIENGSGVDPSAAAEASKEVSEENSNPIDGTEDIRESPVSVRESTEYKHEPHKQRERVERAKGKSLSNGMKVLLTTVAAVVPGLGQLLGLIAAIVFMNSEEDADKRSFGVALLVASLVIFVFSCFYCAILMMAFVSSTAG